MSGLDRTPPADASHDTAKLWREQLMNATRRLSALCMAVAAVLAACGTQVGAQAHHHHHGISPAAATSGQLRTYYIAADEVAWDYAPHDRNDISGQPFTTDEQVFTKQGPNRIGHIYWKALYRGYTDATFTHRIARPTSCAPTARVCDDTLGMLGPVIRAAVGDTIKVVFKNNTTRPTSIHPHGVFYQKDAEGAPYNDGTSAASKGDDAVPPGGVYTYNWQVPDRAGPGPMDGSSVMWMYHSHTDEVADTNSGLMGPMIITAGGQAKPGGRPRQAGRLPRRRRPRVRRDVRRHEREPEHLPGRQHRRPGRSGRRRPG